MKIDFNQKLKKLDGSILPMSDESNDSANLRRISCMALLQDDGKAKPDEKYKRFILMTKIHESNGSIDLKVEEIAMIKEAIGAGYGVLVMGQAWNMLECKK